MKRFSDLSLTLVCTLIALCIVALCWPYILVDKLMDSVFYKEVK